MSQAIVAGRPLSRNDVSHLAKLIEANLLHFYTKPSHEASKFIRSLGLLAGLGFSAAIACGVVFQYEPRLRLFFQMHPNMQGQKRQPESRRNFASLMAIIINEGAYYFKCAVYPSFYSGFVDTANTVCTQMTVNLETEADTIRGLFEAIVPKN